VSGLYRVGNHQPQNVYRGDQYIGVLFSAADAALVVATLNRPQPEAPKPPAPEPILFGAAPVEPCGNCGCDKDWHRARGCTGDFLCCPCKEWVP
jgi:hypothetical protein